MIESRPAVNKRNDSKLLCELFFSNLIQLMPDLFNFST